MKNSIVLFAVLFLLKIGNSQITFEKTFGGDNDDYGSSVLQTNDGGFVIVGNTGSLVNDSHVYLIKLVENGDSLWTRTYGGDENWLGYSIKETNDDGFIITGQIISSGSVYLSLIKTDEYGNSLWTKTYGGIQSVGFDVELTDDGGYIVTGETSYPRKVYLIKTTSNGDTIWTKTFLVDPEASSEGGKSVCLNNDGGYSITGITENQPSEPGDVFLLKTNAEGEKEWSKTYGGGSDDFGNSVQQTIEGGYIITGQTMSFGNFYEVYVIKTNESGDTLWTNVYGACGYDAGHEIQLTNDGGYIICGTTNIGSVGNTNWDVFLIKIDENGNKLWEKTFGGDFNDHGSSVFQTNDDGYIITGTKRDDSNSDVYVIKTDENGIVTWTSSIKLPLNFGLIVTPNPINNEVHVRYNLVNSCKIVITIYNQMGQKTQTLYKGHKEKGIHQLSWNSENISSGIYFIKLQTDKGSTTQKILKR